MISNASLSRVDQPIRSPGGFQSVRAVVDTFHRHVASNDPWVELVRRYLTKTISESCFKRAEDKIH